jgi:hypothetical protein
MRRPGSLNDRKRLHPVDPSGKAPPDEIRLDEIRPSPGESQEERHQRIEAQIDGREFASEIVAGRGALPYGELLSNVFHILLSLGRCEPLAGLGEILVDLQTLTVEAS